MHRTNTGKMPVLLYSRHLNTETVFHLPFQTLSHAIAILPGGLANSIGKETREGPQRDKAQLKDNIHETKLVVLNELNGLVNTEVVDVGTPD
jgi:hypothetical protein